MDIGLRFWLRRSFAGEEQSDGAQQADGQHDERVNRSPFDLCGLTCRRRHASDADHDDHNCGAGRAPLDSSRPSDARTRARDFDHAWAHSRTLNESSMLRWRTHARQFGCGGRSKSLVTRRAGPLEAAWARPHRAEPTLTAG